MCEGTAFHEPVVTDRQFILQDQFQEFSVAQSVGRRFLQPNFETLRESTQPEFL